MPKKNKSMNLVVACIQTESCVIKAMKEIVWEKFIQFDFSKLFPSSISDVKFTQGNPTQINSVFEVTYKDGSIWTFRICEISDYKKAIIAYELVSTSTPVEFSSLYQKIHIHTVTEDKSTYIVWESEFSSDVNSHILQDCKFKKLEYFKDMRKLLEQ